MSMTNPEGLDGKVSGAISDRARLEKFFDAFLRWDKGGSAAEWREAIHNVAAYLGRPLPPALEDFVNSTDDLDEMSARLIERSAGA